MSKPSRKMSKPQKQPPKRVRLVLAGRDSNAHSLVAAFERQAKREGWTEEEIAPVLEEAMSKDYAHLLYVLTSHCDEGEDPE